MLRVPAIATAFAFFVVSGVAAQAKEVWERARPELRRRGVDVVVCKDNPEQIVCLGVHCSGDAAELVSIRSASGAFTGSVRLSAGGREFQIEFSDYDPKLSEEVGASGSRAPAAPELLDALARGGRITIFDAKQDNFSESYSTKGLKKLLEKAGGACVAPVR